ncbi:AcrR family transcriptional regulator [Pedobacter sp. AK017]|uniref:TetR/AcrR family transcriptional regulator n=1 Tax=Pedobacter sp. AK017 TaxID=2723073 RepID=UPI00161BB7D6|nr:TetR/AcrR family transcriptional regulator [Pedobacter sp. AK017]MBB5437346.1 AcrR family transcriptional regulator [Pedobacter sp. AK017]
MVTRKKKNKIRDPERKKREALEATGTIVREDGFVAVTATRVARMIGMDPGMINKRFGSLNGLKASYIGLRDYRRAIFEKFMLPGTASAEELKLMFIEMMQCSLDQFIADLEMQGIVFEQVRVWNQLMYSLSVQLEKDMEPLLALSDPYFEGTGIDFRSLIYSMHGGFYYAVWHTRHNRCPFAGRDLSLTRDYQKFRDMMAHQIEFCWKEAALARSKLRWSKMTGILFIPGSFLTEKVRHVLNWLTD